MRELPMLSGVFKSLSFAATISGALSSAETAYCRVQIAWSAQSLRMFVFRDRVVSFMMVAEYHLPIFFNLSLGSANLKLATASKTSQSLDERPPRYP